MSARPNLSATAASVLFFFAALNASQTRNPPVTVHRADSSTHAHVRELGLDRFPTYSDSPF
ncbi:MULTISPECIES: hypothetical protein [Streptacidiphilus]|uniref:Uncharacterized protein n=2 Tax=Streptacidiphilus TaxID=228398 RepID=A0ABV6UHB6_9ACTN|nr:hypothetical protein [Streptacidiphilus jeojiense]